MQFKLVKRLATAQQQGSHAHDHRGARNLGARHQDNHNSSDVTHGRKMLANSELDHSRSMEERNDKSKKTEVTGKQEEKRMVVTGNQSMVVVALCQRGEGNIQVL